MQDLGSKEFAPQQANIWGIPFRSKLRLKVPPLPPPPAPHPVSGFKPSGFKPPRTRPSTRAKREEATMSGAKASSKDLKKAEQEAKQMAAMFHSATEIGVERELEYITGELRKNLPMMYRLSGFLKDDTLCALLDGRMSSAESALSPPAKKARQSVVLRATWRKWTHVTEERSFVMRLYRAAWGLEDSTACPPSLKVGDEEPGTPEVLGAVLLLLRKTFEDKMPQTAYTDLKSQDDLFAPVHERAVKTREDHYQTWQPRDYLNGFFADLSDHGGVVCTLDTRPEGERAIFKIDGATDYVLEDCFDPETAVSFKINNKEMHADGLSAFFTENGISFPKYGDHWEIPGFTKKGSPSKSSTGDAEALSHEASAVPKTARAATRSSNVAAALRDRLLRQGTETAKKE